MATSGSWNFSLAASEVIQSAFEDLQVVTPGGAVASAHSTMALNRLNLIAKQYQGKSDGAPGMKIHTRQRVTLMLASGQQTYTVGPNSTDSRATTLLGRTTISSDEAAGQTVLSITSNTDTTSYPGTTITMADSDIIGIELDAGTIQWSTISGTPTTTATVADALSSIASAGNYVWWFTSRAQRFPVIETASLRDSSFNDTPLVIYRTVEEYESVVDKFADGDPTSILVEPLTLNTRIILNSQPTDVTKQIYMSVLYPAEDYDATTDDIAFPQEAYRFLHWELAFALSPAVGRWTPEMEKNRNEARALYLGLNPETSSLYFQCNA